MNKLELLALLQSFINEAKSRRVMPTGLSETEAQAHIIRFQNEILQFLDYATNYLESKNPNRIKNPFYLRPAYNQQLKSYASNLKKKKYGYSSSTQSLLSKFFKEVKKNNYSISLLYPKAKHEKPHEVGLNIILKLDVDNLSSLPDSHLVEYDSLGATIGGLRVGTNVSITNSVVSIPTGMAIINSSETRREFNGTIIFADYDVEVEFNEWANSCVKTCQSMYIWLNDLEG